MPASVCSFRNSQRGLTRNVSSFVILILSFGDRTASLAQAERSRCSQPKAAATPLEAKSPRSRERRERVRWAGAGVKDRFNKWREKGRESSGLVAAGMGAIF